MRSVIAPKIGIVRATSALRIKEFGESLIRLNVARGKDFRLQLLADADQEVRGGIDIATSSLARDPDATSRINALLAVRGQMIDELRRHDMRDEVGANARFGDHLRRERRNNPGMGFRRMGIYRANPAQAVEEIRPVLDLFR